LEQSNEISGRSTRWTNGRDPADRFAFALDNEYVPAGPNALDDVGEGLGSLGNGDV
jgi:hypothetical protein